MRSLVWFLVGMLVVFAGQTMAETFIETGSGSSRSYYGSEGMQMDIMGNGDYYLLKDGQIVDQGYIQRSPQSSLMDELNPC